jgi:hypothetical protein
MSVNRNDMVVDIPTTPQDENMVVNTPTAYEDVSHVLLIYLHVLTSVNRNDMAIDEVFLTWIYVKGDELTTRITIYFKCIATVADR